MNQCSYCGSKSITPIEISKEPSLYECLSCNKKININGTRIIDVKMEVTTYYNPMI